MTRYYFEDDYFNEEDVPVKSGGEEEDTDDLELLDSNTFYEKPNELTTSASASNIVGTGVSLIPKVRTKKSRRGALMDTWAVSPEPIQWATLQLGNTVLNVCNSGGYVRREGAPFWEVVKGVPLTGTPYSYIMVETESHHFELFYIHHLVWRAFNGDIFPDWEVRHKPYIPQEYTNEYPNDLCHLDIYPKLLPSGTRIPYYE
jgi:hypothetical protein